MKLLVDIDKTIFILFHLKLILIILNAKSEFRTQTTQTSAIHYI